MTSWTSSNIHVYIPNVTLITYVMSIVVQSPVQQGFDRKDNGGTSLIYFVEQPPFTKTTP